MPAAVDGPVYVVVIVQGGERGALLIERGEYRRTLLDGLRVVLCDPPLGDGVEERVPGLGGRETPDPCLRDLTVEGVLIAPTRSRANAADPDGLAAVGVALLRHAASASHAPDEPGQEVPGLTLKRASRASERGLTGALREERDDAGLI